MIPEKTQGGGLWWHLSLQFLGTHRVPWQHFSAGGSAVGDKKSLVSWGYYGLLWFINQLTLITLWFINQLTTWSLWFINQRMGKPTHELGGTIFTDSKWLANPPILLLGNFSDGWVMHVFMTGLRSVQWHTLDIAIQLVNAVALKPVIRGWSSWLCAISEGSIPHIPLAVFVSLNY